MTQSKPDEGRRTSDARWERIEPLLPPPKRHPTGCHRPRVPKRAAIDAIWLVLRTGMQWNASDMTGSCSCVACRRFRKWRDAGLFAAARRPGLLAREECKSIDRDWLVMDGAMTKGPAGGEKPPPPG